MTMRTPPGVIAMARPPEGDRPITQRKWACFVFVWPQFMLRILPKVYSKKTCRLQTSSIVILIYLV